MNESKLEDHTGFRGVGRNIPKRELEAFFNPAIGASYYAGFPSTMTAFQSRSDVPLARNYTFPFE
jgi:hypothetical protein